MYTAIEQELRTHTGIEVHQGKTQLWSKAGVTPAGSELLTAVGRVATPTAIVWRGDLELPPEDQGVEILGTPLGHPSVRSQLATLSAKHDQLISKTFAHPGSAVRMDSVVVLRFGSRELHNAGGSSKVVSLFCSDAAFASCSESARVSTTKFHVLECCEFAVHHVRWACAALC